MDSGLTILDHRFRVLADLGPGSLSSHSVRAADLERGGEVVVKSYRMDDEYTGARLPFLPDAAGYLAPLYRLRHPHIRPLLGHGDAYTVAPYLPGQHLGDYLGANGPLPLDRALHFLRQAAGALDHAHALGLAHGGLTPTNILITPADHLVVADFGLRALMERLCAGPHAMRGTEYCYQRSLLPLAPAAEDQMALGAVLFHLLTGVPPYPGALFGKGSFENRATAPLPRLDAYGLSGLPAGLQAILDRACSLDRKTGYPNGAALVRALEAARDGDWAVPRAG